MMPRGFTPAPNDTVPVKKNLALGFTLIETLTTLMILIVLATIGLSTAYLRSIQPSSTLNAAVQAIITDLRYASELSTATQLNHTVRFNTQSYVITRLAQPNVIVKEVALETPLLITQTSLPDNTVEFNTLGAATANGTVTVSHSLELNSTIDIRPSGYVRVQ